MVEERIVPVGCELLHAGFGSCDKTCQYAYALLIHIVTGDEHAMLSNDHHVVRHDGLFDNARRRNL